MLYTILRDHCCDVLNVHAPTGNLGYYELKQHKTWFDEECSKLLNKRKQAKLQSLQKPSQTNGDNLNDVRCETNRTFRKKKKEYLK
jgi:hypothetical protein